MSCCRLFDTSISDAFRPFLFRKSAKSRRSYALRSAGIFLFWVRFWVKGSAVKPGLAEKGQPLVQNLCAPGLDDPQDIPKNAIRYLGIVVAQQTFPGFCDSDPRGAGRRCTLCYMDMNRLQRVIFICPEVHPIGPDLKKLRHVQSLSAGKIRGLDVRWTR